ncbi:hypothetical protein HDU92_004224 [Lobulomyces angularis]|nr:hypothetical protein HDU92_004224 [Lobulomyces angularis]
MDNDSIQENEFNSLQSIYGDDFHEITEVDSPWKVLSLQHKFEIILRPTEENLKNHVSVKIIVKFPRNYPISSPDLQIQKISGISDNQLTKLRKIVSQKLQNLKGQEVIFEISSFIEEYLSNNHSVIRGLVQVSAHQIYEDHKLKLELEKIELEKKKKSEKEIREQMEKEMKDAELANKIAEEIQRKKAKVEELKKLKDGGIQRNVLWKIFPPDSPENYKKGHLIKKDGFFEDYQAESNNYLKILVREISITNPFYQSEFGVQKLKDIHKHFRDIIKIRHKNISSVFGAQIDFIHELTSIIIVEDFRECSLRDILRRSGSIHLPKSREYMKSLVDGLSFLHSNNIIHKDVSTQNVVFENDTIKLANIGFGRELWALNRSEPFSEHITGDSEGQISFKWRSPETNNAFFVYTKKDDIWCLGRTFLQMLYGIEILKSDMDLVEFVTKTELPRDFSSLIQLMCHPDATKRSTLIELKKHQFFDIQTDKDFSLQTLQIASANIIATTPPKLTFKEVDIQIEPTYPVHSSPISGSRYENDFDEIEFLGKGGFGQVVKARNKIDNNYYAIKKVPLHTKNKDRSKILREVLALARLHHEYIVRYYTAWMETVDNFQLSNSDEDISEESEPSLYSDDDNDDSHEKDWMTHGKSNSMGYGSFRNNKEVSSININKMNAFTFASELSQKKEGFQLLYIQMEYCERNTLRNVIDDGLEQSQCWKLFRQILEAMAYVHSQGMIHRDLKPSNIFLDAKGNVKIGDFGLATSKNDITPYKLMQLDYNEDSSLTSDVGTPVYCAPETLISGKYNTKVDMYSIGICFFEMIYPFKTAMQRAYVLRDIRKLKFPEDFNTKALENEHQLLLMEEEELAETFRRIVNPDNHSHYSRLISALYKQPCIAHQDLTYDFNNPNVSNLDPYLALVVTCVRSQITQLLQNHGAVEIVSPLLIPKASRMNENVQLLDSSGIIVQLPHDLTFPWVRYITRVLPVPIYLKRYTVDRVFRSNLAGGQPKSVIECDYDIVSESNNQYIPDAEVIFTAVQIIEKFPSVSAPGDFEIMINHYDILRSILDCFSVSSEETYRIPIYNVLEQNRGSLHLRSSTLQRQGLDRNLSEHLMTFDLKGDFETVTQRLLFLMKDNTSERFVLAIKQLRILMCHLNALNLKNKISFCPLLSYHSQYYKGSFIFQIGKRGNQVIDVLAAGGRYDSLLTELRHPFSTNTKLTGVGFNLAIQKLAHAVTIEESPKSKNYDLSLYSEISPKKAIVLIASIGKATSSVIVRMSVCSDLWLAGISADYIPEEKELSAPDILRAVQLEGCVISVMLKHKGSTNVIIKVRNMVTSVEEEVLRVDLVNYVKAQLHNLISQQKIKNELESNTDLFKSGIESKVTILTATKKLRSTNKISGHTERTNRSTRAITERASATVSSLVKNLNNISIIAVELDLNTIKKLNLVYDETGWKSLISNINYQKE